MKKNTVVILFSIFIIFSQINTSMAGGTAKVGLDFNGKHEVSFFEDDLDYDTDIGFSLSLEAFKTVNDNLNFGVGTTYQIPRSLSVNGQDVSFNFWPVYGIVRVLLSEDKICPYLVGQLGYNFFYADDDYGGSNADYDGGIYWGVGAGMIVNKHLLVEFLYSVNDGEFGRSENYFDVKSSQITINLGYNF